MSLSTVTFKRLSGAAIVPFVRDLARLRIDIFREYPYLYDGDEDYELNYLKTYVQSPRSIVMLVFDGNRLVGATTGLPMADETTEFQRPFLDRDLDVRGIFYCGESVLRPSCRGRGIYRQLFRAREDPRARSAASTRRRSAACSVPFRIPRARQTTFHSTRCGNTSATPSIRNCKPNMSGRTSTRRRQHRSRCASGRKL